MEGVMKVYTGLSLMMICIVMVPIMVFLKSGDLDYSTIFCLSNLGIMILILPGIGLVISGIIAIEKKPIGKIEKRRQKLTGDRGKTRVYVALIFSVIAIIILFLGLFINDWVEILGNESGDRTFVGLQEMEIGSNTFQLDNVKSDTCDNLFDSLTISGKICYVILWATFIVWIIMIIFMIFALIGKTTGKVGAILGVSTGSLILIAVLFYLMITNIYSNRYQNCVESCRQISFGSMPLVVLSGGVLQVSAGLLMIKVREKEKTRLQNITPLSLKSMIKEEINIFQTNSGLPYPCPQCLKGMTFSNEIRLWYCSYCNQYFENASNQLNTVVKTRNEFNRDLPNCTIDKKYDYLRPTFEDKHLRDVVTHIINNPNCGLKRISKTIGLNFHQTNEYLSELKDLKILEVESYGGIPSFKILNPDVIFMLIQEFPPNCTICGESVRLDGNECRSCGAQWSQFHRKWL